jgi:hypothetical protein
LRLWFTGLGLSSVYQTAEVLGKTQYHPAASLCSFSNSLKTYTEMQNDAGFGNSLIGEGEVI